jgi:hypothetical protein
MENGFLKPCDKNCNCEVCGGTGDVSSSQSNEVTKMSSHHNGVEALNIKVTSDSTLNVSRDTDSDSGISIVSSTNNPNQVIKSIFRLRAHLFIENLLLLFQ